LWKSSVANLSVAEIFPVPVMGERNLSPGTPGKFDARRAFVLVCKTKRRLFRLGRLTRRYAAALAFNRALAEVDWLTASAAAVRAIKLVRKYFLFFAAFRAFARDDL